MILLNVKNYSPSDSITSQKTRILSNTAWRKLNLATGSFVKCLLYKEKSCEELEFSKNFMTCDQVLINSNMTLLYWIDSLIIGVAISETSFILFLVPIYLTYSTAYRIL